MSYMVRIGVVALALLLVAGPVEAQKKRAKKKPAADKPAKSLKVDVARDRAALLGDDATAASAAAARLGLTTQPGALDALLDGLSLGLDPSVAAAALDGLVNHGKPIGYDVIEHYTHYRNARVRAAAVAAIGALDDNRAVKDVLHALTDGDDLVRAAAAKVVAARKLKQGVPPLLELLKKGDEGSAEAIAELATPDLAKEVGELIGVAPDALLARCLGLILMRPGFKPEEARVEVVRAIGKIPGNDALEQLTTYVASIPETPPRQSRREAEAIVEARLTGGD